MHTYPVVLVHADDKESAIKQVTSWVDTQFEENGQRVYDYGGPVTEDRIEDKDDICRPAAEVVKNIKGRIKTEKNEAKKCWSIVKAFVEKYKDMDLPPEKFTAKDTFPVTYKVGIGIQHLVEAGEEIKQENYPASMGLYHMSHLRRMFSHWEEGRERFITVDACLYTIDGESQQALETGEWDGIWAVVCDFHF